MATKQSAGILLYKKMNGSLQVFLVHPGGPYWQKKDEGSWSVPKGEFSDAEDALQAAKREFFEETGTSLSGEFIELAPVTQKAGKKVYAWAIEGDIDAGDIRSNTFTIEWPPGSRKMKEYPEVDRAGWFNVETAKEKINPAQASLIDDLIQKLK